MVGEYNGQGGMNQVSLISLFIGELDVHELY